MANTRTATPITDLSRDRAKGQHPAGKSLQLLTTEDEATGRRRVSYDPKQEQYIVVRVPRWWARPVLGLANVAMLVAVGGVDYVAAVFGATRLMPALTVAVASGMNLDLGTATPAGLLAWLLCSGVLAAFTVAVGLYAMRALWRASRRPLGSLKHRLDLCNDGCVVVSRPLPAWAVRSVPTLRTRRK